MIRRLAQRFVVGVIDQHGGAAGGVTAIDVAPAVAHHEALREVNAQLLRGALQHPGLRLATIAIGRAFARMITNLHAIQGQLTAHVRVERFDEGLRNRAAPDIGLIGGDDEEESGVLQLSTSLSHSGKNLELRETGRWVWLVVANKRAIDDAVAVEENSA